MSADESIWSRCSPLIRIFPLPLIPMSLQTLAHFSALPPLDPPPCPPLLRSACSVYTGFRQPQIDHRELAATSASSAKEPNVPEKIWCSFSTTREKLS